MNNLPPINVSNNNNYVNSPKDEKLEKLTKGLEEWVNNPDVKGKKDEARKLILEAYTTDSAFLDLDGLYLSSIPPEIGLLTQLQELGISSGNLHTLPPEIGQLSELEVLYVNCCELKSLPPEIGQLSSLKKLCINQNSLESLPPEIGQLSQLRLLDITGNKLQSLPPKIGQLTQLRQLDITGNKLQSLPPEIGQLLGLYTLSMTDNKLDFLPPEIGQLAQLQKLCIDENHLQSLPPEIGQLLELEDLTLQSNPDLAELPMSIGNIPGITYIDIEKTKISSEQISLILELCSAKREKQARELLPKRLKLWNEVNPEPKALNIEKVELTEKEQNSLNEWLVRLEKARDFSRHQKSLAQAVCSILEHAFQDSEFRVTFFNQISANLENCQDRAAMALNEIYTSYRLSKLTKDISFIERLKIIAGCAKTNALRQEIAKGIDEQQKQLGNIEYESVQIFLYYEKELAEKLQLETAIKSMTYETIGKRDWIKIEELIKAVEEAYLDELVDIPAFQEILKDDDQYKKLLSEKLDSIQNEMNQLIEKAPETDNFNSEDYLNWQIHMNEVKRKYNTASRQFQKERAQQLLNK